MKTTTREVLLVLLRADETVSAASVIEVVAVLEGRKAAPQVDPTLVSKSEAARQLNLSRTTLLKIIQEDRDNGVTPPRFVEIETTLGVFRLRECDVKAFGASRQTTVAKRHQATASQQKLVCQS